MNCLGYCGLSLTLRHGNGVSIRTTTTAVDIATVGIFGTAVTLSVGRNSISRIRTVSNTDSAAIDSHHGVIEGMSILAAAIDGALDVGTRLSDVVSFTLSSRCRGADNNIGIINPSRVVVTRTRFIDITS